MAGYTRIYYNRHLNKVVCWYVDSEGKRRRIEEHPPIEYYIPDVTGKSKVIDIYGHSMKPMVSDNSYRLSEFVKQSGVRTCEATLAMDMKFLHKTFGTDKPLEADIEDFQVCTIDIEIAAEREFPKPELAKYPINLITVHMSKDDQYYTFGTSPYTGDSPSVKKYHYCPDEAQMLQNFIGFFRSKRVDILTGWNSSTFDVPYIINRCDNLGISESLSPVNEYRKKIVKTKQIQMETYEICGISVLDGLDLYRKFEREKRVSYSLNNIGVLEKCGGKIDIGGSVTTIYKTNWNLFVEYNIQDVVLTKKINDKKKYIDLAIRFCYESMIPFEKVYSSISVITGYILKFLHNNGMVCPDPIKIEKELVPGAYVEANKGVLRFLLSYDAESLYPTIIRFSNISPEKLVMHPEFLGDLIRTPATDRYECDTPKGHFDISGITYKKDGKGVFPQIVEQIFFERKKFKAMSKVAYGKEKNLDLETIAKNNGMTLQYARELMDEVVADGMTSAHYGNQEYVRKILINSIYGVNGSEHFAFYNPKNAMAVTIWGRVIIQHFKVKVNEYVKAQWHLKAKDVLSGWRDVETCTPVLKNVSVLMDTDSCYLSLEEMIENCGLDLTDPEFRVFADIVDEKFLAPYIQVMFDEFFKSYNIDDNILYFKKEKTITKMLVFAKKKYVTKVIADEGKIYDDCQKLKITGVEVVRTSTPTFCVDSLSDILQYIIDHEDKMGTLKFLRKIKTEFMDAPNSDISFPRGINGYEKWVGHIDIDAQVKKDEYPLVPKGCPIQVRAALMYNYMITKHGLMLQPVGNGGKLKFAYVHADNELDTNVIGFVDVWPTEFNQFFRIDRETQFEKSFLNVVGRFFDLMDWGLINLNENEMEVYMTFE